MRTHSAHAVHIHSACHRIQLASLLAAKSIPKINKFFGMMGNVWKLFYYSPKKMQVLKEVQAICGLPELKVVKPSDTRWLSHERCMRAIRKELPALILTLQQLYYSTGDAEAFGLSILLSCFNGVANVFFLSDVLQILARMNVTLQRKVADFSKLQIMLQFTWRARRLIGVPQLNPFQLSWRQSMRLPSEDHFFFFFLVLRNTCHTLESPTLMLFWKISTVGSQIVLSNCQLLHLFSILPNFQQKNLCLIVVCKRFRN